jgi:CheY-like chemotaxis protein
MYATISVSGKPKQETSAEAQFQPGRSPRILLVEDEKPLRDIVVLILLHAGFDCREAADGRAALDLLASGIRINLVLSNLLLYKVDGFTLFIHVRRNHPRIPFVFVTGVDDAQVRELAMREGAAGYLLKPFDRPQLLAIVRRALGKT